MNSEWMWLGQWPHLYLTYCICETNYPIPSYIIVTAYSIYETHMVCCCLHFTTRVLSIPILSKWRVKGVQILPCNSWLYAIWKRQCSWLCYLWVAHSQYTVFSSVELSVLLFSFISLSVQISPTFHFFRYQIKYPSRGRVLHLKLALI